MMWEFETLVKKKRMINDKEMHRDLIGRALVEKEVNISHVFL